MTSTTPAKHKKERPTIKEMLRDHFVVMTFNPTIVEKVSVDAYLRSHSTLRKYYTNPSMNFNINADYFHNEVSKGYECPRCGSELIPFDQALSTDENESFHACSSNCGVRMNSSLISNSRVANVNIPSSVATSVPRASQFFDPTTGAFVVNDSEDDDDFVDDFPEDDDFGDDFPEEI
tara:strand:+ start:285 stop:815 length:531 start_codon:yes stop_codon:yes gene_type:complete